MLHIIPFSLFHWLVSWDLFQTPRFCYMAAPQGLKKHELFRYLHWKPWKFLLSGFVLKKRKVWGKREERGTVNIWFRKDFEVKKDVESLPPEEWKEHVCVCVYVDWIMCAWMNSVFFLLYQKECNRSFIPLVFNWNGVCVLWLLQQTVTLRLHEDQSSHWSPAARS